VSTRTYGQYCGLAAALDVVGQRWALLIVRDLVPGPRRFTDLFDGLPGISTDLLTDRLRSLESAGAVRRREVRTPVPASLYELTDRGMELAQLAGRLARWGGSLMPDLDDVGDSVVNARWLLQSRSGRIRGGLPDGDVHVLLDSREELTLCLNDDRCRVRYGHTDTEPLLVIESSSTDLVALLRRPIENIDWSHAGVRVTGRIDLFEQLVGALCV
jgi:DNA-binding HxlR family transcriptional regulator